MPTIYQHTMNILTKFSQIDLRIVQMFIYIFLQRAEVWLTS